MKIQPGLLVYVVLLLMCNNYKNIFFTICINVQYGFIDNISSVNIVTYLQP